MLAIGTGGIVVIAVILVILVLAFIFILGRARRG